jgi:hypothetical protein
LARAGGSGGFLPADACFAQPQEFGAFADPWVDRCDSGLAGGVRLFV